MIFVGVRECFLAICWQVSYTRRLL